jgi:MFS transporter, DHA3 family, macrolide efflux protein
MSSKIRIWYNWGSDDQSTQTTDVLVDRHPGLPAGQTMKTFITIWFGQLVSTLGSALTNFALGVWVYETTGSATLFATTMLVWVLPSIALSPIAGVLADRWDRRLVMILADTGAGISSLFIIVMLLTGELQVWHIYVAGFVNAAFSTFQWPAYSAATSLLVPKKHLGRAGGMTQIGEAISQLAAPAIAGALFVTAGLRAVLAIDVATYLIALATLLAVRFPQPKTTPRQEEVRASFLKQAAEGWHVIRGMPGLLGLLVVFAFVNFLVNLTFALYTPLILGLTTPDVLGYLNSAGGLGMLVGTLLMTTWGGPKRRIYGIFAAETVLGFTTFLFGLRLSIPLLAINNFAFMVAMPISNGCSQAIWQTKVAPDIQGRVFAIRRMIAYSIMPLSYALAGPLAEQLFEPWMAEGGALASRLGPILGVGPGHGIALIFVLAGALYTLGVSVILLHPRIRRLELEIPDALPG